MKRCFDILFACSAILICAPVMAVIALIVRVDLGSPVLYRQERPGLHGKPFTLRKFRTMRSGDLPDDARITRFGRLLRSSSLDELPELWNVLIGEMSVVGPRPLLMEYLPLYTPFQQRRHEVKPGLTGWAQVNGRNDLPWERRFEMDIWYVEHRSFWLDQKIIARTLSLVVTRRGISQEGMATMSKFEGSSQ